MIKELKALSQQMHVLYVEDDKTIQKQMEVLLNKFFATVTVANDGTMGLRQYQQNINAYDIVLSDISMPMMNGLDMARAIKEINPEQMILLISAHNDSVNLQKASALGITSDYFIIKPIDKDRLLKALYQAVQKVQRAKKVQWP
ncbi:response regulator [Heliorestis convoluta]|uniref:Stage 0 sporulation protein A homolog n=1 Tax=Heliorestis convoluta TaxID=356322 RepID=A0A5Q2MXC2_9FIRM|nr:response regulator [Heliorestis convoluta]QGG46471.1 response regulator [Heliorestis convoluta]